MRREALAVNLSDIAAMAGRPVAAFVSVGLPRSSPGTPDLATELYEGLRSLADDFETAIAGGDTNSWDGGLTISVTLLGEASPPGPVLRSARSRVIGSWSPALSAAACQANILISRPACVKPWSFRNVPIFMP